MVKKINKLTETQRARMKSWADEWISIGLSTERADWDRFEVAIRKCYKYAGLKNDIPIVRVSSPIVGAFASFIAANVIEKLLKEKNGSAVYSAVGSAVGSAVDSEVYSAVDSAVGPAVYSAFDSAVGSAVDSAVRSAVDSEVYSAVNSAVGSAVYSAVDSEVYSAVGSAVYSAVDSEVYSAVDSEVYSAVDSAVGSAVYSAVDSEVYSAVDSEVYSAVDSAVGPAVYSAVGSAKKKNVKAFWHYWLGGQMWSYWPSFTQFFIEVCGLHLPGDMNDRATAYAELSRSAGYSWPNKNFVMVCDRPTKINRDVQGRLHCEDSMAITWPDGWGLFMWHGVRVPAKLIMDPGSVTRDEVVNETNSEVSRAYAEKLGWERYFKLVDVVKIDAWQDNKTGLHYELYDFKNRMGEDQPRLLRMESPQVLDGTSPVYIEPVHPGLKTAQAARHWQFLKENGSWPTVEESNEKNELVFGWEA